MNHPPPHTHTALVGTEKISEVSFMCTLAVPGEMSLRSTKYCQTLTPVHHKTRAHTVRSSKTITPKQAHTEHAIITTTNLSLTVLHITPISHITVIL